MSRMPPWPVLTLRVVAALAGVRCSMRRFRALMPRDVGAAQVAAVDPRLELLQKLAPQIQVAGDRPGLDERLPLPGAAARCRSSAARFARLTTIGPRSPSGRSRRSTR